MKKEIQMLKKEVKKRKQNGMTMVTSDKIVISDKEFSYDIVLIALMKKNKT